MHSRLYAKQLDIQHVGEPRERMPVCHGYRREGPEESFPGKAALDDGILRNVVRIIVLNEIVVYNLPVNRSGKKHEGDNDTDIETRFFPVSHDERSLVALILSSAIDLAM
jgi:hypothetical protein